MIWREMFVDFMKYMRSQGWRQPIVMSGRKVLVVGISPPPRRSFERINDNGAE